MLSISDTKPLISNPSNFFKSSSIEKIGVFSSFACFRTLIEILDAASFENPLLSKKPIVASTSVALNSNGAVPYVSKNNFVFAALSVSFFAGKFVTAAARIQVQLTRVPCVLQNECVNGERTSIALAC